jgi:hypothetical protein
MRARLSLLFGICSLVACSSGGREGLAATACENAIRAKLVDKSFVLDRAEMIKTAKAEASDTLLLQPTVTFDKGLSSEFKQIVDCRVRIEANQQVSVIFLQFNWSMDDLKKAQQ